MEVLNVLNVLTTQITFPGGSLYVTRTTLPRGLLTRALISKAYTEDIVEAEGRVRVHGMLSLCR